MSKKYNIVYKHNWSREVRNRVYIFMFTIKNKSVPSIFSFEVINDNIKIFNIPEGIGEEERKKAVEKNIDVFIKYSFVKFEESLERDEIPDPDKNKTFIENNNIDMLKRKAEQVKEDIVAAIKSEDGYRYELPD